jgi:hypothetical protein
VHKQWMRRRRFDDRHVAATPQAASASRSPGRGPAQP